MLPISKIIDLMNRNGDTPFLFGIDYELKRGFFIKNPLEQNKVLFRCGNISNFISDDYKKIDMSYAYLDYDDYENKFRIIQQGLHEGKSFLANLTVKTEINLNLTLKDVVKLAKSKYSLYYPNEFVCFSPERFVFIKDNIISANPMKGTIDANIPNAEKVILSDDKETQEHNTIVDLIRSDLSRVAKNIIVDRFRYIDRIEYPDREILQVSSEIKGSLLEDYRYNLGSLFYNILPAGSITGAPKSATVSLIKNAERETRNFYCGVFGYYDGKCLDSAVAIRFIEQQGDKYYFRSGGGITINSNCVSEYEECRLKINIPCK